MWWEIFRVLIVLPVVIVLLIFTLKSIQRFSTPVITNRQMRIIEQLRLTPKASLAIVKIGKQYLVLSCHEEQVQVIRELSLEEVAKLEESPPSLNLDKLGSLNLKDMISRWKHE